MCIMITFQAPADQVIGLGRLAEISPIFRRITQRGVFERDIRMGECGLGTLKP